MKLRYKQADLNDTTIHRMNNKSTDYLWRMRRRVEFADENFAREVMQLFSIGLQKLNNDGTAKRGENGETFLTYTNNEITQYARVWTGFRMGPTRGNVESTFGCEYDVFCFFLRNNYLQFLINCLSRFRIIS